MARRVSSRGTPAAFATASEAATYAPELDIRGTVATGTPYFTMDTAPAVRDPEAVSGVLAYSMYIMYLAEQADPLFKIADYASRPARPFSRPPSRCSTSTSSICSLRSATRRWHSSNSRRSDSRSRSTSVY